MTDLHRLYSHSSSHSSLGASEKRAEAWCGRDPLAVGPFLHLWGRGGKALLWGGRGHGGELFVCRSSKSRSTSKATDRSVRPTWNRRTGCGGGRGHRGGRGPSSGERRPPLDDRAFGGEGIRELVARYGRASGQRENPHVSQRTRDMGHPALPSGGFH
jgi:hypothetical protein